MNRDPGLQPERTSMAWLRTQLLMFGVGILVFKIGQSYNTDILKTCGVLMFVYSTYCTFYTSTRFTKLFSDAEAVSQFEYRIKIVTSIIVSISAFCYALFLFK